MLRVGRPMTTPSSASQSTDFENDGSRTSARGPTIEPADVLMKNQGSGPFSIFDGFPVILTTNSDISRR